MTESQIIEAFQYIYNLKQMHLHPKNILKTLTWNANSQQVKVEL